MLEESAWNGAHRERLGQAITVVRLGKYDILLVWALDRLSREGVEATLGLLRRFRDAGAMVWSLRESWTETSDPRMAELLAAIFAWMADEESRRKSERVRAAVLEGDVRTLPKLIGVATQHRIYAALREFLNYLWRQRHIITFNPIYAVELDPEERPEAQRWSAVQAARFLTATADDPLGLLFRLVVLRGARRGEAVGFR